MPGLCPRAVICKKLRSAGQTQEAGEKAREAVPGKWVAGPKAGKDDAETVKSLNEVAKGRKAAASRGAIDGISVSESAALTPAGRPGWLCLLVMGSSGVGTHNEQAQMLC